jgi:double-stranded uracil-DNA glycosylase
VEPVLPDVLAPGLRIVFCGTAAGTVSARRGAYYAHPQNRFWRTLHEVGLTPRCIPPEAYREVLQHRLGLTDLAKYAFGMDSELPRGVLGAEARAALWAKIEVAQPRHLAFTSLAAGRAYLRRVESFGEQAERIGATRIWALPSPSPAALWNWEANVHWWATLAQAADERIRS